MTIPFDTNVALESWLGQARDELSDARKGLEHGLLGMAAQSVALAAKIAVMSVRAVRTPGRVPERTRPLSLLLGETGLPSFPWVDLFVRRESYHGCPVPPENEIRALLSATEGILSSLPELPLEIPPGDKALLPPAFDGEISGLAAFAEHLKADGYGLLIFGSRCRGGWHEGSDLDLAVLMPAGHSSHENRMPARSLVSDYLSGRAIRDTAGRELALDIHYFLWAPGGPVGDMVLWNALNEGRSVE